MFLIDLYDIALNPIGSRCYIRSEGQRDDQRPNVRDVSPDLHQSLPRVDHGRIIQGAADRIVPTT